MNILVTAGPAYEPIDQVRRITNHSTGSLGSFLADQFHAAGHHVTCLLGSSATFQPGHGVKCREFTTNDSLLDLFQEEASSSKYDAILHVAALSDYRVEKIENTRGKTLKNKKIASREGKVLLHLGPATKVLPLLRPLFPKALIVGWKYETDGKPSDVIEKGKRQLKEARNDAVVLNGPAWKKGFGLLQKKNKPDKLADAAALYLALTKFLEAGSR